jgi:spore coat polysaccharide biosynthesis protein SpsF
MKILAITQARIGSTRLPEKILKTINGVSLLEMHLIRIQQSKLISKLKVATTTETDSNKIVSLCHKLGIEVHKGSLNNVLDRFYETALPEKPDWVIRLTSDCPLIDALEIDKVIQFAIDKDLDYASNGLTPTLPDGMDVEVFKFTALKKAWNEAEIASELEHVTSYIWKNSTYKGGAIFRSDCVINDTDYSAIRLTVDTLEDFQVIEALVKLIGNDKRWMDYVKLLKNHPEIKKINNDFSRNEGYERSIINDLNS